MCAGVAIVDAENCFMKINDGGYYATASPEEYKMCSAIANNVTFARAFAWTDRGYKVSHLYMVTLRKIKKGEELFVEYGESFWYA